MSLAAAVRLPHSQSMSSTPRALVAGAGIAGLTAAKVLHELGWEVDLVERQAASGAVPTGLFIPANGMRAFAALGAAEVLLSCGRVIERLRMQSSDGTAAGAADLAQVWPGVRPSAAVHRSRALRALAAWCPVAVREGADVQSLNPAHASRARASR